MPEGPEVRNYYLYLTSELLDQKVDNIRILSGKYKENPPPNFDKLVVGNNINDILIKGKTIFIKIGDLYMSITHGMTGYWSDENEKNARLEIVSGIKRIYFVDARSFGRITIYISKDEFIDAFNRLGPYVLDDNFTYDQFCSRLLKKGRSEIGSVLLDQNVLSGIGNYLRCDILWYSKIHHRRRISSLSSNELLHLFFAVKNICRYYADMDYELDLIPNREECFVYGLDEDIFGNKIIRETYRGRTIHYVHFK